MNDAMRSLVLILALPVGLVSFTALVLALWVLTPGPLKATAQAIERGRGACLAVGVAGTVIGLMLVGALSHKGPVTDVIGAGILGLMALGTLTGITALMPLLGKGVLRLGERSGTRAGNIIAGCVLFSCAGLVPIVGWVLALYFLLIGLGGALLALVRKERG